MSRRFHLVALSMLLVLGFAAVTAYAAESQKKTGNITAVDAKAKTFDLALEGHRSLTFTVDDKTEITLDGKASTFDDAIKAGNKVVVTYTATETTRLASKAEVTAVQQKK